MYSVHVLTSCASKYARPADTGPSLYSRPQPDIASYQIQCMLAGILNESGALKFHVRSKGNERLRCPVQSQAQAAPADILRFSGSETAKINNIANLCTRGNHVRENNHRQIKEITSNRMLIRRCWTDMARGRSTTSSGEGVSRAGPQEQMSEDKRQDGQGNP